MNAKARIQFVVDEEGVCLSAMRSLVAVADQPDL